MREQSLPFRRQLQKYRRLDVGVKLVPPETAWRKAWRATRGAAGGGRGEGGGGGMLREAWREAALCAVAAAVPVWQRAAWRGA